MEISSSTETQTSGLLGKKNTEENVEKEKSNTFQEMMTKKEEKESEEVKIERTLEQLVADIFSLMKTGMTVDEKERLQELLIELKEKIKEGDYSEEEIEELLSNLEKEIQALQKRISGEVIKEVDSDDSSKESKETDDSSFITRIDDAMKSLEDLSAGKGKKEIAGTSANESELLEMIKEFQK